ncbi:uncharacterized protein N7500_007159 [Penicillium coprophilum]|uniref:uncharacterized protein n=1 Tax=Penicillium coprophilum TaxID=36646 RepID=UPI0023959B0F|nr:uncharacterized protein N7500_007159 [Penicillium coprophilum]KAJ5165329.1 hypothetical protein N7500_007159 [Penicillium coprophilum]
MAFPHRLYWLSKPSPFATLRQPRLCPSATGRLVTYNITSEMQCPLFDQLRWCFELDFMCGYQSTWGLQDHTKDGEQLFQESDDASR